MNSTDTFPTRISWQEDAFRFVKPEEFQTFGIDSADIPAGTLPALKHPSLVQSRFGGNAYGFGLFEVTERLRPRDIRLVQSIGAGRTEDVRRHRKELNRIYEKLGLLIRYTSHGKPYYLIPVRLLSNSLKRLTSRADEISRIVDYHSRNFLKEHHRIALVTHPDDLIIPELSFRFRAHRFEVIDSLDRLRQTAGSVDLLILTKDPFEILMMDEFFSLSPKALSIKRIEPYTLYFLWKIYKLLETDGELFIIADHHAPGTNRSAKLSFKTPQEEKNFILFSHVFKLRRRYRARGGTILKVSIFDFQRYLNGVYVEQETVDRLLGGKSIEETTLDELDALPYLDNELIDWSFLSDQEKNWTRLFSVFFERVSLHPLLPEPVKEDWKGKFSFSGFEPNYLLTYLGRKRPLKATASEIRHEVSESRLMGCPIHLLAEYKDSFEYVIRTLRILDDLKRKRSGNLPEIYADRLIQPLENRRQRFGALNEVSKLMSKITRLERVKGILNPDHLDGPDTRMLTNLEVLNFFGFSRRELREIVLIVLGHTALSRIVSGKMTEKALKPLTDLARTYDPHQAMNLLRYCRLMSICEIEASQGTELSAEQLAELFELYESAVRVIINPDLDWDRVLDEKIALLGGIHNKIIRKLLKMINHFEFLQNWSELKQKGLMEKEALADYDGRRLLRIDNVINLAGAVEQFEKRFMETDPLELPALYRRFLGIEFHGTGRLFEWMDGKQVFTLLWITVNVARGEVVNFNPILAQVEPGKMRERIQLVGREAGLINIRYLDIDFLKQLGEQLHRFGSAFVLGTGFRLRVNRETQVIDIAHVDMDRDIADLETLAEHLKGSSISGFPPPDLEKAELLFSNLESFYQGHLRLIQYKDTPLRLPPRQKRWFQKAEKLRKELRRHLTGMIFRPEAVYTDLLLLNRHAPSLLNFILPEFTSLGKQGIPPHRHTDAPVKEYIIAATRKFQALVTHDKGDFQDVRQSHKLAQKEFGPMATGIVGVSEFQIDALEGIVSRLRRNHPLFQALVKAFVLQDVGRLPHFQEKHADQINPADPDLAGALFLEIEGIADRLQVSGGERASLAFLIRHHSLLHQYLRGELSFWALKDIFDTRDTELFDALFILSFITLSAVREDLMMEDLAAQLFQIRAFSFRIISGKTTLESELARLYEEQGNLFYALATFKARGLPKRMSPSQYLKSGAWESPSRAGQIRAGKMIFATERLFRLGGIRYAGFKDLVNLLLGIPIKYIYKKRKFTAVGYATFERELYEVLRIYNTLQHMVEEIRHFILTRLSEDRVRIFGFEKVSGYLNYENRSKLLLAGLLATRKASTIGTPVSLSFLKLAATIERRYEAVNEFLNALSIRGLWRKKTQNNRMFKAGAGLIFEKGDFPHLISVHFQDRINISRKISFMEGIDDLGKLKRFFHASLQALRRTPFHTDDYELELERVFEKRLLELADKIVDQTRERMDLVKDFAELHATASDLIDRSWEIGLSEDQRNRVNDLYELRKDSLMREKLEEIDGNLRAIRDTRRLRGYWDGLKPYLQQNRRFFGKEYENLIAKEFDAAARGMSENGAT